MSLHIISNKNNYIQIYIIVHDIVHTLNNSTLIIYYILVFHIEAAIHSHKIIQELHKNGAKAGVAINPGTSLSLLEAVLPYVDLVNIMSVNPGFGGQSFIEESVNRISQVSQMLKKIGRVEEVDIEVDGGVSSDTVERIVSAGASFLVAGTYVYGAEDRSVAIQSLRI